MKKMVATFFCVLLFCSTIQSKKSFFKSSGSSCSNPFGSLHSDTGSYYRNKFLKQYNYLFDQKLNGKESDKNKMCRLVLNLESALASDFQAKSVLFEKCFHQIELSLDSDNMLDEEGYFQILSEQMRSDEQLNHHSSTAKKIESFFKELRSVSREKRTRNASAFFKCLQKSFGDLLKKINKKRHCWGTNL